MLAAAPSHQLRQLLLFAWYLVILWQRPRFVHHIHCLPFPLHMWGLHEITVKLLSAMLSAVEWISLADLTGAGQSIQP